MNNIRFFRERLMLWFAQNHRPLPWKGEKDPYKIWLSEIILQQTRVEQGLPYYQRFIARYPHIRDLAAAPEDELLKLWEGLGYYSRARNLHATAKYIAFERNGIFPDTFEALRSLKGVGDYTAAAIASFAFNLPYAVLDGNVFRVIARFFGIETPVNAPEAKKEFAAIAQQLLDPDRPGDFNQAMMDFGATHCTPQQPGCPLCPLQTECVAFRTGKAGVLPVKTKAPARKERFFIYLVINYHENTLLKKRVEKDIWRNLYEFPLLETGTLPTDNQAIIRLLTEHFFPAGLPQGAVIDGISKPYRQTLTHRVVSAVFCELTFAENAPEFAFNEYPFEDCISVSKAELKKNMAVPRIIDWYLQERSLTLRLI